MLRFLLPSMLIATALLGMPALAQEAATPAKEMPQIPADKAMMDGMKKMQPDMASAPMTGDPDKDFVAMMLPHHQGAVDMAKVELKYGKDPAMRSLALRIVGAQDKEIALMQAWQAKHTR